MAYIVKISDFVGRRTIVKNSLTEDEYQYFIDYYEKLYLTELLGAELYSLFITDYLIDGTKPTDPIYTAIYDAFSEDVKPCLVISDGIKSTLIDFIYFEITRKSDALKTLAGNTENISDNSDKITQNSAGLFMAYNEGVNNYCYIQWFICQNIENYPTYNGQLKELITWL